MDRDNLLKLYRQMEADIACDDGRRLAVRYIGGNAEHHAYFERMARYVMLEEMEGRDPVPALVHELLPCEHHERLSVEMQVVGIVRNAYADVLGVVQKNERDDDLPVLTWKEAQEMAERWRLNPVTLTDSKRAVQENIAREMESLRKGGRMWLDV